MFIEMNSILENYKGYFLKKADKYKEIKQQRGMALLGIETGSYNIYRGILVRITLRQYSFERK